jgi:hypothetical protein
MGHTAPSEIALPIQVALEHLAGLTSQHVQVLPTRLLAAAQAPAACTKLGADEGIRTPDPRFTNVAHGSGAVHFRPF